MALKDEPPGLTTEADKTDHMATPKKPRKRKKAKRQRSEMPSPPPPVMLIDEACDYLRMSRASLYRAMDAKRLRYLKYGSSRRVTLEDANIFIASMRVA